MSSQEDNDTFEDTITSPSASVSMASHPVDGLTDTRNLKKRKRDKINPQTISENNITRFKVLKKLNIQLTRTEHHINYLKKCERTKSIPKSLRVNLTPQVPVINSYLQLRWSTITALPLLSRSRPASLSMSSQEDNDTFENTTASPSEGWSPFTTLMLVSHSPDFDCRWTHKIGNLQIRLWSGTHRDIRVDILSHRVFIGVISQGSAAT